MSSKDYLYDLFINDVKGSLELWSGGSSGSGSSGGGSTGGEEWIGDGKTHLWIEIAAEGVMSVSLNFTQTVANGVSIDWGDGSDTQTLSGTGSKSVTHTYASIGEHIVTLDVAEGCTLGIGYGSTNYCVMGTTMDSGKVYCNMLQKVEIGSVVTSISSYAFSNCHSLASILIPESVTSIGNNAFSSCYGLRSIVIPDGVTSIGNNAFSSCYGLRSIVIPESVTSINESTFSGCYGLRSIVIPESVTSIGNYAFTNCYSLASILIPESVTSIGNYALQYCYSLASILIPESVTSINESTFSSCYGLRSIVIPESVTNIGSYAFGHCRGIKYYDFTKHIAVPTLAATTAFSSIPSDCEIRVPAALYDEWIAATNWSTYASKIVAV